MLGFNKSTSSRASERLMLAVEQWKIQPALAAPAAHRVKPDVDEAPQSAKIALGHWNKPSMRALLVIVVGLLTVVTLMWWRGMPNAAPQSALEVDGTVAMEESLVLTESKDSLLSAEVVVHVAGLVKNPGLYHLPRGSRIADAIEAAGGVTKKKAAESVNLAREAVDGEQIMVGITAGGATQGISINSASASDLEELPGVGPVLAARIVAFRDANGPFKDVIELGNVSGIGESILGQIQTVATL